ncbi:hypothetical protein DSL62_09750 [Pantoea sp. 3_1284]|nr:hypothetical protein DSL62_09750 [Pantoea sp. 3_1284]
MDAMPHNQYQSRSIEYASSTKIQSAGKNISALLHCAWQSEKQKVIIILERRHQQSAGAAPAG